MGSFKKRGYAPISFFTIPHVSATQYNDINVWKKIGSFLQAEHPGIFK